MSPLRIAAQNSNYAKHYMQVIEIAYTVMKENQVDSIEIDFLPVTPIPDLKNALRLLKKRFRKKTQNQSYQPKPAVYIQISMIQELREKKRLVLTTDEGQIICNDCGRIVHVNIYLTIINYFKSFYLGRRINKKIDVSAILNQNYRGYAYGLKVLSHTLKKENYAGGSIQKVKSLKYYIYQAREILDYIRNKNQKRHYTHTCIMERFYLYGVYEGYLCDRKHQSAIRLLHDSSGALVRKNTSSKVNVNKDDLEEYINNKVFNNEYHLDKDYGIEFDKTSINIVLFLHSFDDAQYCYGYDGFDDLYDWALSTISILASDKNNIVYIKDHPHIDNSKNITHSNGVNSLMEYFDGYSNVHWLPKGFPITQMKSIPNYVGITHHGTVAEEHAYLNLPLMDSKFSCRGTSWPISITWKTKAEYLTLLRNIQQYVDWSSPGRKNVLLEYVNYQYFTNKGDSRSYVTDSISHKDCESLSTRELLELLPSSSLVY